VIRSQSRAHLARQAKGRLQTTQSLVGRSPFLGEVPLLTCFLDIPPQKPSLYVRVNFAYGSCMATADDHRTYSIRQLCREFGATARALRFYEDKGLLTPARKGQTRVYDARDRARLKLILRGRRIGFTLTEIQEMLDLYDRNDGNTHQMAIALRRHRAQIEALKQQREDLDAAIQMAEEACAAMEARLKEQRPDLLPGAEEYASVLRERLDHHHHHPFKLRA
jgi:DNA-binding transcriptional MerR regulator